jgi:hypothetical protein
MISRLRDGWDWFWHEPVRAERLALMRILLGLALLADLLFQYLPHLEEFFGARGAAPAGLHDVFQLRHWRWTVALFNTDDLAVVYSVFGLLVFCTVCWTVGLATRLSNLAVWFLLMCFIYRNPNILNGGDDTLQVGVFLLLLSPCGRALSVDAWLRRRWGWQQGPATTPAWPVRVLQIQLCVIYFSTGLVKLKGEWEGGPFRFQGTWWEGSSIWYVLNYVTMSRWSYAQLPLPFWFTAVLTYVSVWWEVLFTFLVIEIPVRLVVRHALSAAWLVLLLVVAGVLWWQWENVEPMLGPVPYGTLASLGVAWGMLFLHLLMPRWTRWGTLVFGLLFHLGIWFTIEVGWFSFYTMSYYGVWVPCAFWAWRDARRANSTEDSARVRQDPAHDQLAGSSLTQPERALR